MRAAAAQGHRSPRRLRLSLLIALIAIGLIGAGATVGHDSLRAASVLTRIGAPGAHGFVADFHANDVATEDFTFTDNNSAPVKARIYRPVSISKPPAILVLHGVHHLGIEEPRLQNFSRALASHGYLVMTPELAGIDDYRISAADVRTIDIAAEELKQRTGAAKVGVLGLSFSGGLALIAAADPAYADDFAFVAAVGAHDDLARVLRFFATNEIPQPDGSHAHMIAHEYGPLVVVYNHPEEFFPAADVDVARKTLRLILWEDVTRAREEAAKLSPASQRRMQLLFDHHPDALAQTLLDSIGRYEAEYVPTSPHGHLAGLRAPVFLLHGAADNVIPPAETLWLAADIPHGLVHEELISPVISHVEIGGKPAITDELKLVHWMSAMLDEADHSARSTRP